MSEAMDKKMIELQTLMDDYGEEICYDPDVRSKIMGLSEKVFSRGSDVNETELTDLIVFVKGKIDEYIKTKAN